MAKMKITREEALAFHLEPHLHMQAHILDHGDICRPDLHALSLAQQQWIETIGSNRMPHGANTIRALY